MGFSFGGPNCLWVCKHALYTINVASTSDMWLISLVISDPGRNFTPRA
jgi:hypothetical protein